MFVEKSIFNFKTFIKLRKVYSKIYKRPFSNFLSEDLHTDFSITNVKKSLKSNKLTFEDGFVNIVTECPFCEVDTNENKNKVYINKTTGLFICPKCKYTNQWNILERFLAQQKSAKFKIDLQNVRNEICNCRARGKQEWDYLLKDTKAVTESMVKENEDFLRRFNLEEIPADIIVQSEARVDEKCENIYFPLHNADNQLDGFKVINSLNDRESTLPPVGCSGLATLKKPSTSTKTSASKSAVLVLSIKDFLALHTQKINSTPVCLPYGLKSLPQQCLPALENYSKLILWFFGNDANNWDTSRNFAKKLSEKRCLFIRPTENQQRPYQAISTKQDLKQILSNAQTIWHKAITSFSALREDVLLELQNIEKVAGVKWKRYPVLNRILKGHRRGELTVLTGPTGSGKTTFMSEYSLDLAMQGVSTLWGSFEIQNARLARAMLQQFSGIKLDDNLQEFDYWADKFEELPIYFMMFHGQQSIKVVMDAVEHAQYVHDISHVIIDNVQFMMGISFDDRGGAANDKFQRQDSIIAHFRQFATRKNCHVTLVIHPRKERDSEDLNVHSIFGSAKATQEADNVLIVQDKRLSSVRGKKYLQIAKNRYSGDLGIMPMEFDKTSLSYASKKKRSEEKSEKQEQ